MAPIEDILAHAVNAPSGDNSQPWVFKVGPSVIEIYNKEGADETLYNYKQRGSYFAHGALVENIVLIARHHGWNAHVSPFPSHACIARIDLSPGDTETSELYDAISKRCTNRKPYSTQKLSSDQKTRLQTSVSSNILRLQEDDVAIEELSRAIATNEEVLMENREMHDFLFGMIRYSHAQEIRRPGLYIKTMEFPPPVQIAFRLLIRFWPVVRLLNLFGFSRTIPAQSAPVYRASGALAAIVQNGTSDIDFFNSGRAFQRVWLTATLLGLSVQPTTAIPYLMQRIRTGETSSLSKHHIDKIRAAYATIARHFSIRDNENIAMLFRIGFGPSPSARSHKVAPEIVR